MAAWFIMLLTRGLKNLTAGRIKELIFSPPFSYLQHGWTGG